MQIDLNKVYEGSITKFFEHKGFGFIRTIALSDIFFHILRFTKPQETVNVGEIVSFKLAYSKKHPGKFAATHIQPIKLDSKRKIYELRIIDSEEQFQILCEILDKEKKANYYKNLADWSYEQCTPLWQLKLWLRKYVDRFNFELFKKYEFRLHRQEATEFRKYVREHFKEEKKNLIRGLLAPSKLIEELEDGRKKYEVSWRDIGFDDRKIFFNISQTGENELIETGWDFAKADFNMVVTSYISRKDLKSVRFEVIEGKIKKVEELDQLKQTIITLERNRAKEKIDKFLKGGLTPKEIREQPEFVTLTNEDLLKIFGNHECIDFLQKVQTTSFDMPLLYISERRFNSTTQSWAFENSYLFTVVLGSNKIAIIWESVKLNRATQLFICTEEQYFDNIIKIDEFLASIDNTKKRSSLRADSEEGNLLRQNLGFRYSVEHTSYNFHKWLNNFKKALPEIEKVILEMQVE